MNLFIRAVKKVLRLMSRLFKINLIQSPLFKQEKYRKKILEQLNVDMVADVGANIGQYGLGLMVQGFKGNIISFEPISSVYQTLLIKSRPFKNWLVYQRCAIGDFEGEIEINVSENFVSSSIYNVLEQSVVSEPSTSFLRKEKTKIFKLSDIPQLNDYKRLHLKIDVQGYEEMVLKGAESILDRVSSLEIEISLIPLYESALSPEILLIKLKQYGFVPYFYTSAFDDRKTGGIMQLDGLFIKQELLPLVKDR